MTGTDVLFESPPLISQQEQEDRAQLIAIPNLEKRIEETKHDAIAAFNKECAYCGAPLFAGHIRTEIEWDHYIPVTKGGQNVPWNLLPACKKCNRQKHSKLPEDWLPLEVRSRCEAFLTRVREEMVGEVQLELEAAQRARAVLRDAVAGEDFGHRATLLETVRRLAALFCVAIPKTTETNLDVPENTNNASIIAPFIEDLLKQYGSWIGTATDLLAILAPPPPRLLAAGWIGQRLRGV